jgi:hypothetical protein
MIPWILPLGNPEDASRPALTCVFTATACVLFEFVIFFLLDLINLGSVFALHRNGRETETESITRIRFFRPSFFRPNNGHFGLCCRSDFLIPTVPGDIGLPPVLF